MDFMDFIGFMGSMVFIGSILSNPVCRAHGA